ncbi:MAG: hypothetical protein J5441_05030, partial [Clostridia bacterium]|nr:hypothetical protein [Clostridia bacterium]
MPDNEIINNEEIVSSEEIINNEEIADNGYTAAAEAAAPAEEPVSPETAVPSEAEETASPVQGEVASEAEPRMTEGLLASDKPQSDSNADNPSVSDGAAVLDSSPYTGEPSPAAAD